MQFERKLKKWLCERVCMYVQMCMYMCVVRGFSGQKCGLIYCDTGLGPEGLNFQLCSQWTLELGTLVPMNSGVRQTYFSIFVKEIKDFSWESNVVLGGLGVEIKKKIYCCQRDKSILRMGLTLMSIRKDSLKSIICKLKFH